jgi:hypothetical protein
VGRNAQVRRFRRDLDHELNHKGPSGESNPFGNREFRRSKAGKAEMIKMLTMLRNLSITKEEAKG